MALIAMAVYSTEENKKDDCLLRTLESLSMTVDFKKHRLILSVNAETSNTMHLVNEWKRQWGHDIKIIHNYKNIGTAEAINKGFKLREEGENCIKMDDDVVIHSSGWIEVMEDAIRREPKIGIIGLKRKDCIENVNHSDEYFRSSLLQLPQVAGERWINVEKVHHVMGTCQMYSSALLDKIGYLYQPKQYGWDDVLASSRSKASGFINVFIPHVEIDHIDEGKTPYQVWKERHAGLDIGTITKLMDGYSNGTISTYYNPFSNTK